MEKSLYNKSNSLKVKIQDENLKRLKAEAISFQIDDKRQHVTLEALCQSMSDTSFQTNKPVKSIFDGNEFVIDAGTSYIKAMAAYCDQCMNIDEESFDTLKGHLEQVDKERGLKIKTNPTFRDVVARKATECIVKKYPQRAEEIDTINLLEAYFMNYGSPNSSVIEKVLKKSVARYMNGEDTFAPNVYNVSVLSDLKDFMYQSGMYELKDIESRTKQTELQMIGSLEDKELTDCSYATLSFIGRTTSKYPDCPAAQSVHNKSFNVVKNKLNDGCILRG